MLPRFITGAGFLKERLFYHLEIFFALAACGAFFRRFAFNGKSANSTYIDIAEFHVTATLQRLYGLVIIFSMDLFRLISPEKAF